jgi:hypothetical protein
MDNEIIFFSNELGKVYGRQQRPLVKLYYLKHRVAGTTAFHIRQPRSNASLEQTAGNRHHEMDMSISQWQKGHITCLIALGGVKSVPTTSHWSVRPRNLQGSPLGAFTLCGL